MKQLEQHEERIRRRREADTSWMRRSVVPGNVVGRRVKALMTVLATTLAVVVRK